MNEKVNAIVEAIREKKGIDISVIDLTNISSFADYFVIATGISSVQTNAIRENIEKKMRRLSKLKGIEGERSGVWILMDYSEVIVHIFQPKERMKFSLEDLWADGKTVRMGD
ncbi:MAG: ribosome silencing factor [bacterium]